MWRARMLLVVGTTALVACDDGIAPRAVPIDPEGVGRIALAASRDRHTWRHAGRFLALMSADGSAPRIQPVASNVYGPTWSPDGRTVAYARAAADTALAGLWTYDPDTRTERRVPGTDGRTVVRPQWSPDGGRLLFADDGHGDSLVVVRSDGGDRQVLPPAPGAAWGPGDQLAFIGFDTTAGAGVSPSAVYVRPLEGGATVRASPFDTGWYGAVAWSRDGRLAAIHNTGFPSGVEVIELVPGAPERARVIYRDTASFQSSRLAWSPSGYHLLYDRMSSDGTQLWIVRADGSRAWPITPVMRSRTRYYGNEDGSWAP